MIEKVINVGIAGYGYSAKVFHIPFLKENPRFSVKKVYSRRVNFSEIEEANCQMVHSFDELLSQDIDLVVICTPNTSHYELAKEAIEAGKNVIVEKPLCTKSKEAIELKQLAEKYDVKITAYQNRRLDGPFLTAKQVIDSGELGEIKVYEASFDRFVSGKNKKAWKNEKVEGVNILYDLGTHLIDQAILLWGKPNEVYADVEHQRAETPDFDAFELVLYYSNKKVILRAGELVADEPPHIVVRGTQGSFVKFGRDVQEGQLCQGKSNVSEHWGEDDKEKYGKIYLKHDANMTITEVKTLPGNYGKFYENFYDVITGVDTQFVDITDSILVLEIIEAALKSAREKKRIKI